MLRGTQAPAACATGLTRADQADQREIGGLHENASLKSASLRRLRLLCPLRLEPTPLLKCSRISQESRIIKFKMLNGLRVDICQKDLCRVGRAAVAQMPDATAKARQGERWVLARVR